MYRVYDSYGNLVRGGFSSYQAALEYKLTYGNSGWTIIRIMSQEEREKRRQERRQETLRKMRVYKLHASEVDILEEAGEL